MRLIYWPGEGVCVCVWSCLCVCWYRGLQRDLKSIQTVMYSLYSSTWERGGGILKRRGVLLDVVSFKYRPVYQNLPSILSSVHFFLGVLVYFLSVLALTSTLSECRSKRWHVSSSVALMSESGGGDIYITLRGWEPEPTGMKSSSTDSASPRGHHTASALPLQNFIHPLPPQQKLPPHAALLCRTWPFY